MSYKDLKQALKATEHDLYEVSTLADEVYENNFKSFFKLQRELASSLTKGEDISDSDLQDVLINAPLKLFEASEALNKFRLSLEVLRTRIKSKKISIKDQIITDAINENQKLTQAEIAILVEEELSADDLLIKLYESVIKRVENEMSYSKELIMSAKKIFTARAENIMPVSELDEEKINKKQQSSEDDKYKNLPEFHV